MEEVDKELQGRIDWVLSWLQESEKLTDWETDFINSLTEQFEQKGTLSKRQVKVLERIYREEAIRDD